MPEWLEVLLKVAPLAIGIIVGVLQLWISERFSRFEKEMNKKIDALEEGIDKKYPARDLVDAIAGSIRERVRALEDWRAKRENGGPRR